VPPPHRITAGFGQVGTGTPGDRNQRRSRAEGRPAPRVSICVTDGAARAATPGLGGDGQPRR
jgi:hypothetical protein